MAAVEGAIDMEFAHVHAYVDSLRPLSDYKALEAEFNQVSSSFVEAGKDVVKGTAAYEKISGKKAEPDKFTVHGQDLVEQLITGVGFRITGECAANGTRSVLVNSQDPRGAKFVITTREAGSPTKKAKTEQALAHFAKGEVDLYYNASRAKGGRPGIAVLAFESSKVAQIKANYEKMHPALVHSYHTYGKDAEKFEIFEAFAYYKSDGSKQADPSTRIRFLQRGTGAQDLILPGFNSVECEYPVDASPAYSDHWVSNVVNREEFLDTLNDTLNFTSKVDFNAGVVAAGEAIIESTVTGNNPGVSFSSADEIMLNQSQIYLPINNALSEVGHVHLFLEELGQGIQHLASRVHDLTAFVERANNYRKMTGQGFTFLNIPRSYYGYLTHADLVKAGVPSGVASVVMTRLQEKEMVNKTGIVKLDLTQAAIEGLDFGADAKAHMATISEVVLKARYNNMYKMLGDHFSAETYLKIVENKILVDIQAGDILFQIFTGNILQRASGQESPFLEFIQRVCSVQNGPDGKPKPIRPGCGGFGIRNFLTLFLSIEVSKAMTGHDKAVAAGDEAAAALYEEQVLTFTEQLDLSNPILTKISDAMTAEADARLLLEKETDAAAKATIQAEVDKHCAIKNSGQEELQALSDKYKALMRTLREKAAK